jgi:hypothetical protein
MIWPEDRSRLIADAYELRETKGIALLLRMGSFDLWRGSLAQMRGDLPASTVTTETDGENAERFLQTLAVSRAFDVMPPKCAETMRLAYFDGRAVQGIAEELETSGRYAATLVENCTKQLFEVASVIYQELSLDDADEAEPETHAVIPLSARSDHDSSPAHHK